MDQPTEEHHLKDLGSTEGADPDAADPDPRQGASDATTSPETLAGTLGLEGAADNPTGDDRFLDGPPRAQADGSH